MTYIEDLKKNDIIIKKYENILKEYINILEKAVTLTRDIKEKLVVVP